MINLGEPIDPDCCWPDVSMYVCDHAWDSPYWNVQFVVHNSLWVTYYSIQVAVWYLLND